jgi:hypothetical protein
MAIMLIFNNHTHKQRKAPNKTAAANQPLINTILSLLTAPPSALSAKPTQNGYITTKETVLSERSLSHKH